jgi:hypothetical protein
MTRERRGAAVGGTVAFAAIAVFAAMIVDSSPDPSKLLQFLGALAFLGVPYTLAGAIAGWHLAAATSGHDSAARLVGVTTSERGEWGTAMRAELASIDDPGERRRFAIGCARATLVAGPGRGPLLTALGAALLAALTTFAISRASLAGDQAGALFPVIGLTAMVLLVVGAAGAAHRRSFRGGLVYAAAVAVAAFAGIVAVGLPESQLWAERAGAYILDGDAPRPGIGFDPVGDVVLSTLFFATLFWSPFPFIGAGLGAALTGPRRPRP